jgi:hypothetical protein
MTPDIAVDIWSSKPCSVVMLLVLVLVVPGLSPA